MNSEARLRTFFLVYVLMYQCMNDVYTAVGESDLTLTYGCNCLRHSIKSFHVCLVMATWWNSRAVLQMAEARLGMPEQQSVWMHACVLSCRFTLRISMAISWCVV